MVSHYERVEKQIQAERAGDRGHWAVVLLSAVGVLGWLTGFKAGALGCLVIILIGTVGTIFQDKSRLHRAARMDDDDKAGRPYKL